MGRRSNIGMKRNAWCGCGHQWIRHAGFFSRHCITMNERSCYEKGCKCTDYESTGTPAWYSKPKKGKKWICSECNLKPCYKYSEKRPNRCAKSYEKAKYKLKG